MKRCIETYSRYIEYLPLPQVVTVLDSQVNKFIELVILVSGMSTVWEDTYGCANQYRYNLAIYLMALSHNYIVS